MIKAKHSHRAKTIFNWYVTRLLKRHFHAISFFGDKPVFANDLPLLLLPNHSSWLVVPVIDILLYGLLPLWLTCHTRSPYLAAANGQWIAFTRDAYRRTGGHAAVKDKVVDDVELSRLAKRKQVKSLTVTGTSMIQCRMYRNSQEIRNGFRKNFFRLAGFNILVFSGILAARLTAPARRCYFARIIFRDSTRAPAVS